MASRVCHRCRRSPAGRWTIWSRRAIVHERRPAPETLPVPIAYEVAAIDILGEPILVAAGVERSALVPGAPYPASIIEALDDRPIDTASGLLQPGEVSLADPVALGIDDWSLVWGARLPQSTVDGLVGQVVADSYRPIERTGIVCFVGVFQTSDEAAGAAVLTALQSWAANAPVSTQAVATSLGATRVELQACDPGAGRAIHAQRRCGRRVDRPSAACA